MRIGTVDIGPGHPTRIIAELGNAANGSLDRMLRLMDAARDAGADLLKGQAYRPSELLALRGDGPAPEPWGSQGYSMKRLYDRAATPFDWWPIMFERAEKLGLPLFASVFGAESLALMESLGSPCHKIARLDNEHEWLADAVRATGKPIIVSGATVEEVDPWREVPARSWKGVRPRENPALALFCPVGYPQPLPIIGMRERFDQLRCDWDVAGCDRLGPEFDGFSYHGTDIDVPVVAATLGAKLVEFHFHLEAEPSELEANVSLNERQVTEMVAKIRKVESLLA